MQCFPFCHSKSSYQVNKISLNFSLTRRTSEGSLRRSSAIEFTPRISVIAAKYVAFATVLVLDNKKSWVGVERKYYVYCNIPRVKIVFVLAMDSLSEKKHRVTILFQTYPLKEWINLIYFSRIGRKSLFF